MTEKQPEPDRSEIICPLSLKVDGVLQNYRVHWRPNQGLWESRPQKESESQKGDSFAEEFYRVLHEDLNEPDANSFKFTHEQGIAARERGNKST
jgi:hypothetical protein